MRLVRACFVVCTVLFGVIAVVPATSAAAPAPITGTVTRDHDQDGTRDSRDPGLAGVTVVVTDGSGTEVGRSVTATDGTYSVAGTDDAVDYRVEFQWTQSFLQPSALGPDNGSSIQFASGGDSVDSRSPTPPTSVRPRKPVFDSPRPVS